MAEISSNHNGILENAKKLILDAKKFGADAVKLQTYTPSTMTVNSRKKYFKINEGSNSIGSKSDNSITITDGSISSKHAIILYKQGQFLISDEMSSNGTFVNGEELQPRIPSSLMDGDEIKVGDTTFLFRVAFKS